MKRALVLAGGGLKVAYQAGALQVLLDETDPRLEFEIADGASGGTFNLAMWAQGQSGREIADNWRLLSPWRYLWPTFARFRRNVYPDWGLNFAAIRRSNRDATFNVFDFTGQRLLTKAPAELSEDWLDACVALPLWFPAKEIGGRIYVDAAFVTDANLEAAIAGGADELWVIWTVSRKGVWRHGPISKYFQIVEESANGTLQRVLDRIDASNAKGAAGEFGRTITVRKLIGDVPIHYLLVFRRRALARAVEQGVEETRSWCRRNGYTLGPPAGTASPPGRFRFGERMAGTITGPGWRGRLELDLTARIADVDAFVADPTHPAQLLGAATCDALTGTLPVERGELHLFVADRMTYRLHVRDAAGHPLTIVGEKRLTKGRGIRRAWRDTTTLYTQVLQGDVPAGQTAPLLAEGILRLSLWAFLRELATFHGSLHARLGFARFFVVQLWRRYRWWR